MLARANRIVRPAEFRAVVRRGRRIGSASAIVHVLSRDDAGPIRVGIIVSKAVGNAVTRNRVRRRLRASSRDGLDDLGVGKDIVIRALPGSPEVDWATLHAEIIDSIRKGVKAR